MFVPCIIKFKTTGTYQLKCQRVQWERRVVRIIINCECLADSMLHDLESIKFKTSGTYQLKCQPVQRERRVVRIIINCECLAESMLHDLEPMYMMRFISVKTFNRRTPEKKLKAVVTQQLYVIFGP